MESSSEKKTIVLSDVCVYMRERKRQEKNLYIFYMLLCNIQQVYCLNKRVGMSDKACFRTKIWKIGCVPRINKLVSPGLMVILVLLLLHFAGCFCIWIPEAFLIKGHVIGAQDQYARHYSDSNFDGHKSGDNMFGRHGNGRFPVSKVWTSYCYKWR